MTDEYMMNISCGTTEHITKGLMEMKKHLMAYFFVFLTILLQSSAFAEKDCWFYARNGYHDFEQTNFFYSTCTQDGYYIIECRQCGLSQKEITMPATGHQWEDHSVIQQPDCARAGSMQTYCSYCGRSGTRTLKKTEHSYGTWTITVPAAANSMGTRISSCFVCGNQKTENFYPEGTLYRGSYDSDGIMELQLMLVDCGYLSDSIDGKFGKNTEKAVIDFQTNAGLQPDGIAWPQTIALLEAEWELIKNPYAAMNTEKSYVPFCYSWQDESGQVYCEFCQRHAMLWEATSSMLIESYTESALYSYYEWQAEVISLYNEWIMLTDGSAQAKLEANKALCIQLMEAQLNAMQAVYEANDIDIDPSDIYYGMELWMRSHSAWLCEMIGTLETE